MTSSELELSYSHNNKQVLNNNNNKKCSICQKATALMKLPDEFQEFAAKKGFESWFCGNCVQVVNFCK